MFDSRKVIKKLFELVALLASILVMSGSADGSWWDGKWHYRRKLSFDTSSISEDLTNFPVLVVLNSTNFVFSRPKDNAEDIRFIDSDGTNVLKHEIEKWDKEGSNAWVWVKVPKLDKQTNADSIFMYYGNSGAPDAESPEDVWDSHYVMVQHMNDDPDASRIKDSTSNTNDGTKTATNEPLQTLDGKIGSAQDFDGTNDYVLIQPDPSLSSTQAFSIEAWVKIDTYPSETNWDDGAGILVHRDGKNQNTGTWNDYDIHVRNTGTSIYRGIFDDAVWHGFESTSTNPLKVFVHIVYTYEASTRTQRFYINGTLDKEGVHSEVWGAPFDSPSQKASIGWQSNESAPFDGVIDEVRFSNTTRSGNWIKACYINQNYFSTFCTVGEEEGHWAGTVISFK